jgi:quinol monooxygenase YgiN
MKIVRVQYTTTQEFAATNQQNIAAVTRELKQLDHPGIKYSAYVLPDGKTFMHFDQFENEAAHQVLQGLESFKKFAAALWASNLEAKPELDLPDLVASTENFFD